MSGLEKMYKENDPLLQHLKGRRFLVELTGEPINLNELKKWDKLLDKVFGELKEKDLHRFVSIYGLSETLMIGVYRYRKSDKEIQYEVKPNSFCIVIDEKGNPIVGEKGKIEVTKLINNLVSASGTVLPRYITGDLAIAKFKDGTLYLINPERDPEKGQLSIIGNKLPLDSLPIELAKLGLPIQIQYQLLTVNGTIKNEKVLNLNIFADMILKNPKDRVRLQAELLNIIKTNYSFIVNAISGGFLKVRINIVDGRLEKSWQLLPEQNITQKDYLKIVSETFNLNYIPLQVDRKKSP